MSRLRGHGLGLALAVTVALTATTLVACAPSPPATAPRPDGKPRSPVARAVASPAADRLPPLEALAARGPVEAPLMHELLRAERAAPRSAEVRADRDLCLRAVFAATRPVRAWFADAAGTSHGEAASGTEGAVPPRGPLCAKKGETLHLVVEGLVAEDGGTGAARAEVAARAIIFAAP